jgi:hypothetical protein
MSGRSSIDSLQQLAPVSDLEAATVFAAGREELLAGVLSLPPGRTRIRQAARHRRTLVVAIALTVFVAAGTAAGWAILGSSARETTSIECVIRGTDTIIPATSGDPAYDCAVTWKNDLGTDPPPLVAYDNGNGGVTVVPRAEKPQPGWRQLPAGQDVELIQLQDSLDDYINGLNSACLGEPEASALAQAKLAEFGFTGWTVTMRNQGSCTNADIVDPASKTVTLISTDVTTGRGAAFERLADKLRPVTKNCLSLPAAVRSVRTAAEGLTYKLSAVEDNSVRCASIYETVGGTILLTVRGPNG